MDAVTYATSNLKEAFGLVNMCAAGVDEAQYNWKPSGTCNVMAKSHVHVVSSVDFFINGLVKGGKLGWSDIAQARNLPENPRDVWTFDGAIPLAAMQEYSDAVQSSVLEYVSSLKDADLDREIETQFFGTKPVAWLVQLAGNHAVGHAGDMAAIKGMQGLKGLPF